MKVSPILTSTLALICLSLSACDEHKGEHPHQEHQKIVVTCPKEEDQIITQQYVCQIHSQRHIEVCALANGYLEKIALKEGQVVKEGEVMFKILPTLYKGKLARAEAKAKVARLELDNTNRLLKDKIVSSNEAALFEAKLEAELAEAQMAQVELNFTTVKAPFAGIVDRLHKQQGTAIKEGEVLTTLSDNSTMWVYFNVPETRYLDYMTGMGRDKEDPRIELVLANGTKFQHGGKIGAVEAKFDKETGNIPFRADFPNPELRTGDAGSRLLRHGQTGNVLIHRTVRGALVIPQRATFEILDRRYVFVIAEDGVVHQREIVVLHELGDIFLIKSGLTVQDKFVYEGVQQVRDGEKVEFEFRSPDEVMANQKHKAE